MKGGRVPRPGPFLPSFVLPGPPVGRVLSALHDFCLKNTAHNKRCSITAAAAMRNGPGDNYSQRTRL